MVSPVSFIEIAIKGKPGPDAIYPGTRREAIDRALIATALAEDVSIVANDGGFKKHKGLRVTW